MFRQRAKTGEDRKTTAVPGPGSGSGPAPHRSPRFFRSRLPVIGLGVICFLFLLAVFAPFIAGNKPLVFKGETGGLLFPVFKAFTGQDFFWLAGFCIFVAAWLLGVLKRRAAIRRGSNVTHRVARTRALFAVPAVVAVVVIALMWPEQLDRSDYTSYRDSGNKAVLCVMPLIPYSPAEFDFSKLHDPPGKEHWLGTDQMGRDELSRLIHGARVSMLVGFVAVSIYVLIGVVIGAMAGYFGGMVDILLSRLIEVVICFPVLFAILAVFCFLPPNMFLVMALIGLLRWPGVARLVRGEFLRLKNEEYVAAGKALGLSSTRMIFVHMLPNGLGPVLVSATFGIAGAILIESGLSFLGFGVQPPIPSWGRMLADGKSYIDIAWGLTVFPGAAIFFAVTAFNLVGEGLRDALDPRMR